MATLVPLLGLGAGATSALATVATIAGPVLGVAGAMSENRAYRQQASEFERQGREEQVAASIRAERVRRASRMEQSASRVSALEGGAMSGTMQGVIDQNAVSRELDALMIGYEGRQRAAGLQFQAGQARSQASPLRVFSAAVRGFSQMDPMNLQFGGGGNYG